MRIHGFLSFPPRMRHAQALVASGSFALLAACGHATPPASSADAQDTAIAAVDAHGNGSHGQDGPLQPPPPGTLHYTIELSGDLHKTGPGAGEKRDATIRRRIEVTSYMRGVLVNGDLAAANRDHPKGARHEQPRTTTLDALAKQGEACKGDAACMMKVSMKLMADSRAQQELQQAGKQMVAMIGRTVVWSQRAPCKGRAAIDDNDDSAAWREDADQGGMASGLDQRKITVHADATFDCRPALLSDDPAVADHLIADGTQIYFDKQTGAYDIVFAPEQIDADVTVDGKPGEPKKTGTPKIAMSGFEGAAIGKPISGSKKVNVEYENGVPLHAEINWTFTPDKT